MSNDENKELGKLVNINEDACEFYDSASVKVEDPDLKRTFARLEELHSGVVIHLKDRIRANGERPEAEETFVGKTRKLWGETMANISNNVDETLVKNLEEAEDRCLHSMQEALEEEGITPATKALLQEQCDKLQKSHDYMRAIKYTMHKAA